MVILRCCTGTRYVHTNLVRVVSGAAAAVCILLLVPVSPYLSSPSLPSPPLIGEARSEECTLSIYLLGMYHATNFNFAVLVPWYQVYTIRTSCSSSTAASNRTIVPGKVNKNGWMMFRRCPCRLSEHRIVYQYNRRCCLLRVVSRIGTVSARTLEHTAASSHILPYVRVHHPVVSKSSCAKHTKYQVYL